MLSSTVPLPGMVMGNPTPPPPCALQRGYGGAAALAEQLKTGTPCVKAKALTALELLFRDPEQCAAAYRSGKARKMDLRSDTK